jgi:hypothetical protein
MESPAKQKSAHTQRVSKKQSAKATQDRISMDLLNAPPTQRVSKRDVQKTEEKKLIKDP